MLLIDFGKSGFKIECEAKADGNMFCVGGVGWCFATMPYGFGLTIPDAVHDFRQKVHNSTTGA